MTIKNKITTVLSVFIAFNSLSQEVEVRNGSQFKMEKSSEEINTILDASADNFTFLVQRRRNFKLMSLDSELDIDETYEIDLPEVNGKKVRFLEAQQSKDNSYFYSQYFDRKSDEMTMFASQLDVESGKFEQHLEGVKVQDDKFGSLQRPFRVVNSIDSSTILIVTTYPIKNKENARFAFKVVDKDYNMLWQNDIVFDEEGRNFTAENFLVDKNGNIHIVATVRISKDEKKEKGAKSRYVTNIYSYFHEENELKQYEIGFKNEIILNANVEVNKENELICTGFYGDNRFFDAGMKGLFFLRIDANTKQVVASSLSEFDKDFLAQVMNKRRAAKGKSLNNFLVRDVFVHADGGMSVVTEKYIYVEGTDQNGAVTRRQWTYGDVAVFFLSPEGEVETYSVIKKNQYAYSSGTAVNALMASAGISLYPGANEVPYYGIASMMKDDVVYVLYNANPKNLERANEGKKPKSVRQRTSVTQLVMLDREGTADVSVLFKSKDKDAGYKMPLMPRYSYEYSEGAMLVIGRKGKNARVTEVKVK
ncbi:MAG: hypothetical protein ACPGU5_02730 [Lishizhenia sp.]